ncbi:MAG TPA: alanine racemase [Gemmatimonadaceae bacterium]|jgi:D-serine deaminase-like pyridoxal phosphate-dependent protein|nr:alanine racemase [Gemmatimonadaceae bacterium]
MPISCGSLLSTLETPAALVDLDRLEKNLERMAEYSKRHGIALRPHIKTHKSTTIAAAQIARGAAGLTCATPAESGVMSAVTDDILLAYPAIGPKLARLMALPREVTLTVALDSAQAVDDLARAAREADRAVRVYIELDVGMHRVGVAAWDEAIALARRVKESVPLEYAGINFYPGHIRSDLHSQDAALEALGTAIKSATSALERAGLAPRVVSGGSTPTVWRTHEIGGITEMRPGTYVYNDRGTSEIGACSPDDCALTVLATVVSTSVPGQAVIDAGAKALGREPMRGVEGEGWGALLDRPEVLVSRMSEEHGILDLSKTSWRPQVGELVRVVPNHVCIVVHLNDVMYGVRGSRVETSWLVDARGRSQSGVTS